MYFSGVERIDNTTMDGKSLTPEKIKLQQLQEILPEAFSEGKTDWEKLRATLGEDVGVKFKTV